MIRFLTLASIVILIALQVRLWLGDTGYFAARQLNLELEGQLKELEKLEERNRLLAIEVNAYRNTEDYSIIEDRARSELGMIMQGETFYLVIGSPD